MRVARGIGARREQKLVAERREPSVFFLRCRASACGIGIRVQRLTRVLRGLLLGRGDPAVDLGELRGERLHPPERVCGASRVTRQRLCDRQPVPEIHVVRRGLDAGCERVARLRPVHTSLLVWRVLRDHGSRRGEQRDGERKTEKDAVRHGAGC